jgi:flagellar basal-body rod modification protein FlgD
MTNVANVAGAAATAVQTGLAPSSTSASARASLSRDDFYKIMISELSNQDPMDPMDNRQFLEQLASLQTLDTTGRLSDGMDRLVLQNRMASASGLIGRSVTATTAGDTTTGATKIQGKVERVLVQGGNVQLVLDGDRNVKLDDLTEIS